MRCASLAKGFALDALALRRKGKARADYFYRRESRRTAPVRRRSTSGTSSTARSAFDPGDWPIPSLGAAVHFTLRAIPRAGRSRHVTRPVNFGLRNATKSALCATRVQLLALPQNRQITPHEDLCRETAFPTQPRSPWAHQDRLRFSDPCPGPRGERWRNFIPNCDLSGEALFKVRMRTSRPLRNELSQPPQGQLKFHLDRFACSRHSFFCWKATSPCPSEVGLWKS